MSTSAKTKPSALIHMPSNLQYCLIHSYPQIWMTEIHTSTCKQAQKHTVLCIKCLVFHFNNSPPALMVIRSVSRQPLNLETLSKGVRTKKTWSNLAAQETECACVYVFTSPTYSQLNIMCVWENINLMTLAENALKQCCHFMYYLVIFLREIGWIHPLRGWNETACSNYNKTIRALYAMSQRKKGKIFSLYKGGHSAKHPNCKMSSSLKSTLYYIFLAWAEAMLRKLGRRVSFFFSSSDSLRISQTSYFG